jgi:hypothetical protein
VQSLGSLASLAPLLTEALWRVVWISVLIAAGMFLANLAVAFGAVERFAGLSRHLTGPANLPDAVGTAVLATTASATAGYGMLAEFRESGALDDRATLVAVTMNTFFGFAQHVFTYYVPVLIPILGLRVGVMYVGARAAISLAITLVGVAAGALLLSGANVDRAALDPSVVEADGGDAETPTRADRLREAATSTGTKLKRIVPRLAIVYTVVTVLVARYDPTALTALADPITALVGLPGAAVAVVVVFALDTTAGAATVAPLVGSTFSPRAAVATMLIGGIVSFAVSTFKRSIPFQYGIWGPRFGSKVIAVNTALKVVFIAVAVAVLLLAP